MNGVIHFKPSETTDKRHIFEKYPHLCAAVGLTGVELCEDARGLANTIAQTGSKN
ncbi:hypothetical protein HMI01_11110 [Halolactibacillus miurensis]|uniref:Uncharacterized protein n=1 Tax=Halolactibacillus miurensis TaxID=306541 RepID=A0A1I6SGE8_9BACI|nr:hypothetical protein HMI01_11110 [Halolactibacillus miurensis]SFS76032.1 hypothetical protein SAMN05421668_10931 [Halolactibacillus miurensis]